jgi:hypothetical protein
MERDRQEEIIRESERKGERDTQKEKEIVRTNEG